MKEYKDIQITLTKDFHDTYWKNKMKYIKYALIFFVMAFVFLIAAVIFDALPVLQLNLKSIGLFAALYFCIFLGTFSGGLHFGMGEVGRAITKRIHEEHPELFEKVEKKDD